MKTALVQARVDEKLKVAEPEYKPEFVKMVLDSEKEYFEGKGTRYNSVDEAFDDIGKSVSFETPEAMSKYILSGGRNVKGAIVKKGK